MFIPNEQDNEEVFPPAYLFICRVEKIKKPLDTVFLTLQNRPIFDSADISSNTKTKSYPPTEDKFINETELFQAIEEAINGICRTEGFIFRALAIEGSSVHIVISALIKPEAVWFSIKSAISQKLTEAEDLSKLQISENVEKICLQNTYFPKLAKKKGC